MSHADAEVAEPYGLTRSALTAGDGVLELLEVWRLLEPALAARAAKRISSEEIAGLHRLCDEGTGAASLADLAQNDVEFHRRIAAAAGNFSLGWLLDGLTRPAVSLRIWRAGASDDAERMVTEHRGIVDALASRNAELTHCWCTVHIAGVEDRVRAAH